MFARRLFIVGPLVAVTFLLLDLRALPARAYQPPVDAPIADPWRPPIDRYSAGNRGVDFATSPGQVIRSAEAGRVQFVGQVGGTTYVVVEHFDGRRSTYGNMASVAVSAGQHVSLGSMLGSAAGELHFGVREGDVYINPMGLFEKGARLVELDAPNIAARTAISRAAYQWVAKAVTSAVGVPVL